MENAKLTYLERYQQGEYEAVWTELTALGAQVLHEPLRTDVYDVACATMLRVRENIETLIPRLQALGYRFGIWEEDEEVELYSGPLVAPIARTQAGIARIEQELGVLPLSLRAFAEIVGSVDFRGHHPEWAAHKGLLDPLVVEVPFANKDWCDYVIETARDWIQYFTEEAPENAEEGYDQPFIEIAGDAYHKDNISGGPPYKILIGTPMADGMVRNILAPGGSAWGQVEEPLFLAYLRDCLQWGGFPGFANRHENGRPEAQLEYLTQGLRDF